VTDVWATVAELDMATQGRLADGDAPPAEPRARLRIRARRSRSHGFVETGDGDYMLTIVDRGADMLQASGRIG
jgi:hypothetical protein